MIEYLQSPQRSVWDLADRGDAFVWGDEYVHDDDRATIALAAELAAILSPLRMSLDGLPSLTATLFVIAALRSKTNENIDADVQRWAERLEPLGGRSLQGTAVAKWLSSLSQFPSDLRSGVEGPLAVLGCGLENSRRSFIEIHMDASDEIIEVLELSGDLRNPYVVDCGASSLHPPHAPRTKRAWETLLYLSRTGLDAAGLRTWKSTGLVSLPVPTETIDPIPNNPINRLLSELMQDEKLAALAQLSRTTASLLTLPRRPSDPDMLPIGGVSDVTNRGNPERLLMTELAADPMLLLARIANGQALYLRRETPPGPSPDRRPVAIESGIRCWGDTRVRLAALALAIAASEERRGDTQVDFSVIHDDQFVEQNFSDREGLTAHLETLQPSVHPGVGIAKWFEEMVDSSDSESSPQSEPMILMSADSEADPTFRESIRDVPRPFLIATVSRVGDVRLLRRTHCGDEILQQLTLEIPRVRQQQDQSTYSLQPLFLSQNPSPVSHNIGHQTTWCSPVLDHWGNQCLWIVTKDNRLLAARSNQHGASEVVNDLPHNRVLAYHSEPGRLDLVVGATLGPQHCVSINTKTWAASRFKLPEDFRPTDTSLTDGYVLRFNKDGYQVVLTNSRRSHLVRFAKLKMVGSGLAVDDQNRLLRHGGQKESDWHVISQANSSIIEPIQCAVINAKNQPCVVVSDLSSLVEIGEKERRIDTNAFVYADDPPIPVLRDTTGQNWLLRCDNIRHVHKLDGFGSESKHFRVDTENGQVSAVVGTELLTLLASVDRKAVQLVSQKSARKKFQSVQMTSDGLVTRSSARSAHLLGKSDQASRHLVLSRTSVDSSTQMIPFDPANKKKGRKQAWSIRSAKIDGGTAWLDSRGFIHLQRDDDSRELTLIMVDRHVAGWFSETGYFGPPFFAPIPRDQQEPESHSTINVPNQVCQWLDEWSESV